jgi:hypothetical protein
MENKKIKNATPEEYNNIKFKSKIEIMAYKTLLQHGFKPEYETHTYTIWEGFRPTVPFFTRNNSKTTILNLKKLINITYTPDFYIEYEGLKIIIEVKGQVNDVFPYKFKLFRKHIEDLPDKDAYIIFEIFTKKQLLECIEIAKKEVVKRKENIHE